MKKGHRRSIRLKDYDYSSPGYYFVTVCTNDRQCLFGGIQNGRMELNSLGEPVQAAWMDLPKHYPDVELDAFVLMPNHLHAILILKVGAGHRARPGQGQAQRPAPTLSLPDVIQRFKSFTTHLYMDTIAKYEKSGSAKLWQRNYYEHVIRREESLEKIRQYIGENPLKWDLDEDNPRNFQNSKPKI